MKLQKTIDNNTILIIPTPKEVIEISELIKEQSEDDILEYIVDSINTDYPLTINYNVTIAREYGLTEAPAISDDMYIYYYGNYAVRSFVSDILDYGYAEFTNAETQKKRAIVYKKQDTQECISHKILQLLGSKIIKKKDVLHTINTLIDVHNRALFNALDTFDSELEITEDVDIETIRRMALFKHSCYIGFQKKYESEYKEAYRTYLPLYYNTQRTAEQYNELTRVTKLLKNIFERGYVDVIDRWQKEVHTEAGMDYKSFTKTLTEE